MILDIDELNAIEDGLVAKQQEVLRGFEMAWRQPKSAVFNCLDVKPGYTWPKDDQEKLAEIMRTFLKAFGTRKHIHTMFWHAKQLEEEVK